MAVFQQLFELRGSGFHVLNQALLTLLPKIPDVDCLSDFTPISLIHIIRKLFAKLLSLHLAPRLSSLVLHNQSAFIDGCCLHDNFVLVRQSARLLHQLPRAVKA